MKSTLYSTTGEKKGDINLPSVFSSMVREDLAAKYFETEKFRVRQPYSNYEEAGRRHSASGTISHRRHEWKGHYGKGISRVPRKAMSRRGVSFFWIGAEVSNTRGGRSIHAPVGVYAYRKINKKERSLAMNSAFAATAHMQWIMKRYSTLESINVAPAVVESLPVKTKDLISLLQKIFANASHLLFKTKSSRAGKGKRRGRKYKSNAGALIVVGKEEKTQFSGIDVMKHEDVTIADLYPLGRIVIYTKKALEEMK